MFVTRAVVRQPILKFLNNEINESSHLKRNFEMNKSSRSERNNGINKLLAVIFFLIN